MYTFDARIRYSETNSDGVLSLESLLDYFQDASTFHSEDLGVGIDYLKKEHMVWVLSAWQIVVDRYPRMGEKVIVGTFPNEFKGFFGTRNFFLKDMEGNYLAKANSIWTLLDTQVMRPVKPPQRMLDVYETSGPLEMDYASRKIDVPDGGEEKEPITVHRNHLDTNNHVNNGQYVRMAMDFLPGDFEIGQMRAEYKKQALLGDVLYPFVVQNETVCTVTMKGADGTVYVNVEFTKKRKL